MTSILQTCAWIEVGYEKTLDPPDPPDLDDRGTGLWAEGLAGRA
jgi:hypothetical protein